MVMNDLSPSAAPLGAAPGLSEEALAPFLAAFYAKVRQDDVLGPVFAAAIADEDWPAHMARIEAFWSSVMLASRRYKGNPFGAHVGLREIGPEHFTRWLGLFGETARELFAPDLAAIFEDKAQRIGASLQAGLFFRANG